MKKVVALSTLVTLVITNHAIYSMEQQPDCKKHLLYATPLLTNQQILDSVNSQEPETNRTFQATPLLSQQQMLESQEYSFLNEDMHIRGQLKAVTRDLKQTEDFLLEAQSLPQDQRHILLIKTYNCLEKIRKQIGYEETRELSLANKLLRTTLCKQLEIQAQNLELLAKELPIKTQPLPN